MNYEPPQRGFKTFLLLTGLGVLTFFTARAGQVAIRSYTRANVTEEPSNVRISNLGPTGVSISWHTKIPTTGYLEVFNSSNHFEDLSYGIQNNHHLTIESLQPNTLYQFKIGVGSELYESTNLPFEFRTTFQYKPQNAQRAFGQIIGIEGSPEKTALVYLTIRDNDGLDTPGISTTLSSITNSEGIFSIELERAQSRDLTAPFYFSPTGDIVEISSLGKNGESATVLLTTSQTQPTPQIQLQADQKILDLTNQPKIKGSSITLPLKTPKRATTNQERLKRHLLKMLIR